MDRMIDREDRNCGTDPGLKESADGQAVRGRAKRRGQASRQPLRPPCKTPIHPNREGRLRQEKLGKPPGVLPGERFF